MKYINLKERVIWNDPLCHKETSKDGLDSEREEFNGDEMGSMKICFLSSSLQHSPVWLHFNVQHTKEIMEHTEMSHSLTSETPLRWRWLGLVYKWKHTNVCISGVWGSALLLLCVRTPYKVLSVSVCERLNDHLAISLPNLLTQTISPPEHTSRQTSQSHT